MEKYIYSEPNKLYYEMGSQSNSEYALISMLSYSNK